jgi:hypothetical protein
MYIILYLEMCVCVCVCVDFKLVSGITQFQYIDFLFESNQTVSPGFTSIYVWNLNQTVLELDLWIFRSSLDGIWTHTIDTLQHQSLSLMSSALDHSTTSAILKYYLVS